MGLTAVELKAIATLENKQFQAGIAEIDQSVSKFGAGALKQIGGMIGGAFAVGAIINFGHHLMQESATAERFARTIGMSSNMLHELGTIAVKTGADADGFSQKIVKMLEAQDKATTGDKELVKAFSNLGVSMQDLTSLTPDELLLKVADGAQKDSTAIHDLNLVMGKGAAGEYGAALKDIANNGLPAIDKAAEDATRSLAAMNAQYEGIKNKVSDKIKGALVDAWNFWIPGAQDEASQKSAQADKQRAAQNAARLAGLQQEHNAAIAAISLDATEKTDKSERRKQHDLDNITVQAPRASDSMAAYGRMIGGQFQGSGGVAERQLKELEIIAKYAEEQAEIADKAREAIEALGGS